MIERKVHPNSAQVIIIKFLTNKSRLKSYEDFKRDMPEENQEFYRPRNFMKVQTYVENSPQAIHHRVSLTEGIIDVIRDMFEHASYYCQLSSETKRVYCWKRNKFQIREVILLHDNVRPHTTNLTFEKLEECIGWDNIETNSL